jgi:hypothetical protein
MGTWSRLAGDVFLDWLAPSPGLRWIDIGCGGGAFTELPMKQCAPAEVYGIDPSPAQLAFARARSVTSVVEFHQGEAMALPFPDNRFDVATMALVIFFVPNPGKGISEMVRVVTPGGLVAAYAWDMAGGGFPMGIIQAEMRDGDRPAFATKLRRVADGYPYEACGPMQVWRKSRRTRLWCRGCLQTSTTIGRRASWARSSPRLSLQCRPRTPNASKRGSKHTYRRMQPGASPTMRVPTRSWVVNRNRISQAECDEPVCAGIGYDVNGRLLVKYPSLPVVAQSRTVIAVTLSPELVPSKVGNPRGEAIRGSAETIERPRPPSQRLKPTQGGHPRCVTASGAVAPNPEFSKG